MARERIVQASAPLPASSGTIPATPFQYYVTGEESLVLNVWSSAVCRVVVSGRWYRAAAGIEVFRHDHLTNGDPSTPQAFQMRVQEGYLLNCAIEVEGAVVMRGQCFAQLVIGRGSGAAFVKLGTVLQGYVGSSKFLGFPGSPLEDSLEGPGFQQIATVANPAAGAEWSTLPGVSRLWRMRYVYFELTTAGGGANRDVFLRLRRNGISTIAAIHGSDTHPPATLLVYSFQPGVALITPTRGGLISGCLPTPFFVHNFDHLGSLTSGIAAGDQHANIRLGYEEWLITDTTPPVVL